MSLIFQWPYRESRDGIWGIQTSTLNWCEEDYNITKYCAEFFNTTTNVTFLLFGLMGIRDCLRHGHGSVYLVAFVGYIIVGLGSMAFHATLKYSMQLADELPMIYTTCIMAYATFAYSNPKSTRIFIGLGLVGLAAWITIYYHKSQNPVFHQVAYAILTLALVFRTMYDMEFNLRPALRKRSPSLAYADDIMKQIWKLAGTGIVVFLLGFFLWNIDNIFCQHLRNVRHSILLPWAMVFEGHAWWHLFTGLGAYYLIMWRLWLERCLNGDEIKMSLKWPSPFTSVPRVLPRPEYVQTAGNSGIKKML